MALGLVVLAACIGACADALPLSGQSHLQMLELLLPPIAAARLRELDPGPFVDVGVVAALAVAARRTLVDHARTLVAPSTSARRPALALVLAALIGAALTVLVGIERSPWSEWREAWTRSPYATGLGLLTDGALVMIAARAPDGTREGLGWGGAVALGLGVATAALPGVSRVAVALALTLWLGVRPRRAIDIAWICAIGGQLGAAVVELTRPMPAHGALAAVAGVVAFVSALAASRLLLALVARRRLTPLSAWSFTLAVASLAYAKALPV